MPLKAYFDGSGEPTDPIERATIIGGCIATVEEWDALEPRWYTILKKFRVTEFKAAACNCRDGEFKGWLECKRRSFLQQLADVINTTIKMPSKPIAALLPLAQFQSLPQDKQKAWGNNPYFVCLQDCITFSAKHAHELYIPHESVSIFCDEEPEEVEVIAQRVHKACRKHLPNNLGERIGAFSYEKSHKWAGLQVADFVAYECLKLRRDMIDQKDDLIDKTRWGLNQLLKLQCEFEYYREQHLWERKPLIDYSITQ